MAGFKIYRNLAPGPWFNSVKQDKYRELYFGQLSLLDARKTWDELHRLVAPNEPVLLCWERPPFTATHFCHRRMVALWFHEQLGKTVNELGESSERKTKRPASGDLF